MVRDIKLLEFSNPVFHDGVNVTVRRGTKWLGVHNAYVDLGGKFCTGPVVLHTRAVPFNELTDSDVQNEHDPSCRTVAGLATEMKRVYPEFSESDTVTLATFILKFRKPVVGDDVYVPDMAPAFIGKIEEIIALNDDFYEIHAGNRKAIVHATQYQYDIFSGKDGWFVVKTY